MTDSYSRPGQPMNSDAAGNYQTDHNAAPVTGDSGYPIWSADNYSPSAGAAGYPQPGAHPTSSWLPPVTGQMPQGSQPPAQPARRRSTAWRVGVSAAAAAGLMAAAMTGFGAGLLFSNAVTDEASVRITGDGLPQLPGLGQGSQGQGELGQGSQGQGGSGNQTLPDTQSDPYGEGWNGDGSAGQGLLPDGSSGQGDSSDGWSIPGLPDISGLPGMGGNDQGRGSGGWGSSDSSSLTLSPTAAAAAQKVNPSVVNIDVNVGYGAGTGAGTGIILTADGKVLTNAHVISGGSQLKGTVVGNNRTYPISVLGYDKSRDVALVQLQGASGLTPAQVDNSDNLRVGDLVVGVGNAGGAGGQPTSAEGRVTETGATITASDADGRNSETLHNLIGTDAKIQAGQSGGPMVDGDGEVIGMNTAAAVGGGFSGAGQSTGYAIPINDALAIANQIASGQSSDSVHVGPTAFLGVQVAGADGDGVAIAGVVSGSAAEKAGLVRGDRIVSIDAAPITTAESLSAKIRQHKAGDQLTVEYVDASGARKSVTVVLGSGPAA